MAKAGFRIAAPAWSITMGRVLDARADLTDVRDLIYAPSLKPLKPFLTPFDTTTDPRPGWWSDNRIRNQGRNPSCVGHALAALVDHMRADALLASGGSDPTIDRPWASAEMIYQIARFHDEWTGEDYNGSSIRGALKGFFYNGVASQQEVDTLRRDEADAYARDRATMTAAILEKDPSWYMTKRLQEEARTVQLGAYYRIRPRLADMHAALNEAKAVIVSATTHEGWMRPNADEPTIVFDETQARAQKVRSTMHAFSIVGYDSDGFWIQNSWGRNWGHKGIARWLYEDWAANVVDAWVLRLAILPAANDAEATKRGSRRSTRLAAYGARIDRSETHFLTHTPADSTGPSRLDVLGHFVPFRDGLLDRYGPYNVNSKTLLETISLIQKRYIDGAGPNGQRYADEGVVLPAAKRKYRHILIYFVGGWPDEDRLASDIALAVPCFLRLGIYPFFISWDTPIFFELAEIVKRRIEGLSAISRETTSANRTRRDRMVEFRVAEITNRILRDLRQSARRVFRLDQPDPEFPPDEPRQGNGSYALNELFKRLGPDYRSGAISYHVAAHGFGAQMLLECLAQQQELSNFAYFSSCTLLSPLVSSRRLGHQGDRSNQRYSLFDCLLLRGDRPRRRGRLQDIGIESLRLIVLDEAALKADRFIDGYGRSWPDFFSLVMAHDPVAKEKSLTTTEFGAADGAARTSCQKLSLLALPEEAEKFVAAAADAGFDVERFAVVSKEEVVSSLHHELGFHPSVLDNLASKILGRDASGSFIGGGRAIDLARQS